jgi:hypothetical protein
MAFSQCCEFTPLKDFTKKWGFSTSIKKNMKDLGFFQPLLNFLAFVKEFFHLPSLVLDLELFVLTQNLTLKLLFSIKVFRFIKHNISTNDNILGYKVVQFVPFC